MPWVGDSFKKLRDTLPQTQEEYKKNFQLYHYLCPKCGYSATRKLKWLTCGCGFRMNGELVYMVIDGQAVLDKRR